MPTTGPQQHQPPPSFEQRISTQLDRVLSALEEIDDVSLNTLDVMALTGSVSDLAEALSYLPGVRITTSPLSTLLGRYEPQAPRLGDA